MNRGYFGIGIYHPKAGINIGTLWRSAYNFGASFIFTIGRRYKSQSSDTTKTPRHIPLYHYLSFEDFNRKRPAESRLVAIEQIENAKNLKDFSHPLQAIYLLGAEDYGIPKEVLDKCNFKVEIKTPMCLNVAVAGSIVMFDRNNKTI